MPANGSTMTEGAAPAVGEDALLGGRVRFLQPRDGYRVAIDPVLLAAAAPVAPGMRVLDLGCGAGAIALCLLARCPDLSVTGLEGEPAMAELARRNAALNGVADRFRPLLGRVETPPEDLGEGYDLVATNPPYLGAARADAPPSALKAAAHVEGGADLAVWIAAAHRALRAKGRLAMIHRADRLGEILAALSPGFGDILVHPLWPKPGRAAKRVVVLARKGVASPLTLSAGTVLHDEAGRYTVAAAAALAGAPLAVLGKIATAKEEGKR